ncbi:MAG: hypothetical protein PF480_03290 [Roseovarius sp.]|jgi:hypothetical protein|nr:hypothetical protein [Roseovarius sp.]
MKTLKLSSIHLALLGAIIIAALAAGGFWYAQHSQKISLYVQAAADCQNGIGAGRLLSLDDLYGLDARPDDLYWVLSSCEHEHRMERIRYLQDLRDALSN